MKGRNGLAGLALVACLLLSGQSAAGARGNESALLQEREETRVRGRERPTIFDFLSQFSLVSPYGVQNLESVVFTLEIRSNDNSTELEPVAVADQQEQEEENLEEVEKEVEKEEEVEEEEEAREERGKKKPKKKKKKPKKKAKDKKKKKKKRLVPEAVDKEQKQNNKDVLSTDARNLGSTIRDSFDFNAAEGKKEDESEEDITDREVESSAEEKEDYDKGGEVKEPAHDVEALEGEEKAVDAKPPDEVREGSRTITNDINEEEKEKEKDSLMASQTRKEAQKDYVTESIYAKKVLEEATSAGDDDDFDSDDDDDGKEEGKEWVATHSSNAVEALGSTSSSNKEEEEEGDTFLVAPAKTAEEQVEDIMLDADEVEESISYIQEDENEVEEFVVVTEALEEAAEDSDPSLELLGNAEDGNDGEGDQFNAAAKVVDEVKLGEDFLSLHEGTREEAVDKEEDTNNEEIYDENNGYVESEELVNSLEDGEESKSTKATIPLEPSLDSELDEQSEGEIGEQQEQLENETVEVTLESANKERKDTNSNATMDEENGPLLQPTADKEEVQTGGNSTEEMNSTMLGNANETEPSEASATGKTNAANDDENPPKPKAEEESSPTKNEEPVSTPGIVNETTTNSTIDAENGGLLQPNGSEALMPVSDNGTSEANSTLDALDTGDDDDGERTGGIVYYYYQFPYYCIFVVFFSTRTATVRCVNVLESPQFQEFFRTPASGDALLPILGGAGTVMPDAFFPGYSPAPLPPPPKRSKPVPMLNLDRYKPRIRPKVSRSLRLNTSFRRRVNPLRNRRIVEGSQRGSGFRGRGGREPPARRRGSQANGVTKSRCSPCMRPHEVRVRLHPAYTSSSQECGRCVESISLKLVFPDVVLDSFDVFGFQDALAEYLDIPQRKIYLRSIEGERVEATVVLLPTWVFEVPPNATLANATIAHTGTNLSDLAGGGNKSRIGSFGSKNTSATFRSGTNSGTSGPSSNDERGSAKYGNITDVRDSNPIEEDFDPTSRDFSNKTLARLDRLLSSHYLPGVGKFDYVTTTGDKFCNLTQTSSKLEVRDQIASDTCSGADGFCTFVWGNEVPSSSDRQLMAMQGFEGGLTGAAQKVYDLIYQARFNDDRGRLGWIVYDGIVALEKDNLAGDISRAMGSVVKIPALDMFLTGGFANFSAKNCTDCSCFGKVETAQPYLKIFD